MRRAFILLMDSFGIGEADDAAKFGDKGANTFGHIMEKCHPDLPTLTRWGLFHILAQTAPHQFEFMHQHSYKNFIPAAAYGYAQAVSTGKDTPSGHWEIAGAPVLFEWGYFPKTIPCFPEILINHLIKQGNLTGLLGLKHASGTDIINELGEIHIKTEQPIVYTSADSVFQIAAHEQYFGLEKLYKVCNLARQLLSPYNIGRVIARPFLGSPGNFYRTSNRRDISLKPPGLTLLDKLVAANRKVIAIGKIADIFAHQGISESIKAAGNQALFEAVFTCIKTAPKGSLTFVNFVDFDMLYGHRRDIQGYSNALIKFDQQLSFLEKILQPDDMIIITADHGCDPTFPGSDHTREYIPILMYGKNIRPYNIGKRKTFADIGQTIAEYLEILPLNCGTSFLG